MIRVAIAEDHPELRLALRLLLKMNKEVEIVCEAGNGQEAVDCVKRLQPDVLVMDIHMPVMDGFLATKQIADLSVRTRVILISAYRGIMIARNAAELEPMASCRKMRSQEHYLQQLKRFMVGKSFSSNSILLVFYFIPPPASTRDLPIIA